MLSFGKSEMALPASNDLARGSLMYPSPSGYGNSACYGRHSCCWRRFARSQARVPCNRANCRCLRRGRRVRGVERRVLAKATGEIRIGKKRHAEGNEIDIAVGETRARKLLVVALSAFLAPSDSKPPRIRCSVRRASHPRMTD